MNADSFVVVIIWSFKLITLAQDIEQIKETLTVKVLTRQMYASVLSHENSSWSEIAVKKTVSTVKPVIYSETYSLCDKQTALARAKSYPHR